MNKELVIERLQATIDKLSELREEQFYIGKFVEKWDLTGHCGTVCCIAGWYPKWFPECLLRWDRSSGLGIISKIEGSKYAIITALAAWHGLEKLPELLEVMFYMGENATITVLLSNGEVIDLGYPDADIYARVGDVKPHHAIELFTKVRTLIEQDLLTV